MNRNFELRVAPRDAVAITLSLNDVQGVSAKLGTSKIDRPKERIHGSYSMAIADLAPVIISVASGSAAFLSLAAAILNYAKAQRESEEKKNASAKAPVIAIQNITVSITDFPSPEALAKYLQVSLEGKVPE